MGEPISVILPMHRWHARAMDAIRSVLDQTARHFELLLVFNGGDEELDSQISPLEALDDRIRILRIEQENLSSALNHGIRSAKHGLIARMDDDDLSHPDRFELQRRYLAGHRELAGCGTGASFVDERGVIGEVLIPPTTPEQARWRMMLWNPFVHGSMMLRKQALLKVDGYDERLDRAQDYDLWVRLGGAGLSGISDLLYTHLVEAHAEKQLDRDQSAVTTRRLMEMWARLPDSTPDGLESAISALTRGNLDGRLKIEEMMEAYGPTRSLLTAWLWSCWRYPIKETDTAYRLDRVHRGRAMLESLEIEGVWIWGAGDFGRFLLAHRQSLGVRILGVLDEYRVGCQIDGFVVKHPSTVQAPSCVLIGSDLYEDQIWHKAHALRDRGVQVLALPSRCPRVPDPLGAIEPMLSGGDDAK